MRIRSSKLARFENSLNHVKPCLNGVGAVNFNQQTHKKNASLSYIVKFILAPMT